MRFEHVGFGSDAVEYRRVWALQRAAHAEVVAGAEDVVLLLEHEAVYTAGKRTLDSERPFDGTPVVDVDRGGKITWHGPGQLVGYPITRLPDPVDVVAYVRRLEQVLIDACAELGLATERVEGRSGVWVRGDGPDPTSGLPGRRDRKVGAIGIRVAQGVTMHGFALNCDNVLDGFGGIVPCGIPDADVTTLSAELGRPLAVADALPVVERHLARTLTAPPRADAVTPAAQPVAAQPAAAGV